MKEHLFERTQTQPS